MRPVTEPLPRIKPGRGGTQGDRQVQIFKSTTAAATMLTVGGGEGVVAWRRRVAAGRGQTVRPSVRPSVRGLPVQATHNGGGGRDGGRGQTTSLPKRKRGRRGGKKLLICATWTNEGGREGSRCRRTDGWTDWRGREGRRQRWRKRAAFWRLAAVPLWLRRCSVVLTRGKALETFGHNFRFHGMELLPFGGPIEALALREGGDGVPRSWRRCLGPEVPSYPISPP